MTDLTLTAIILLAFANGAAVMYLPYWRAIKAAREAQADAMAWKHEAEFQKAIAENAQSAAYQSERGHRITELEDEATIDRMIVLIANVRNKEHAVAAQAERVGNVLDSEKDEAWPEALDYPAHIEALNEIRPS